MNWDDVRIFLAVARTGQLLSASRRLDMNHATVGRRLTALEKALGTRLVNRRPAGCELTAEGEAFLAAAERMETEMLGAQSAVGRHNDAVSGTVRVGAPDGFGVSFLAPRLGALIERHPELKIELVPVPRSFSLARREADIAITVDQPSQGRLVARKLTDYTLGLYAARTYLDRNGAPQSTEDLRAHRLIGYVDDLIVSPQLAFTAEIWRGWDVAFGISSATGQVEAARSGAGIAILHDYIASAMADLVPVLPGRVIRRSYWTVVHETSRDLARVRTVLDHLVALVAENRGRFCRPL
jgi:DNA-binding transcriptional LysR family regulator